jgi:hypothetical protein
MLLGDPLTHARRGLVTALIQRAVVIVKGIILPARFGVTKNE